MNLRLNLMPVGQYRSLAGKGRHLFDPLWRNTDAEVSKERYILSALLARKPADNPLAAEIFKAESRRMQELIESITDNRQDARILRLEVRSRRLAAMAEAEAKAVKAEPTRFLDPVGINAARVLRSAQLQNRVEQAVIDLTRSGMPDTPIARRMVQLFAKFQRVVGPMNSTQGGGWDGLFGRLVGSEEGIVEALRTRAARNAAVPAGAKIPYDEIDRSVQSYRSMIKGALVELYLTKYEGWRTLREGVESLAEREVLHLNKATGRFWETRAIGSDFRLDGALIWDDALPIVSKPQSGDPYPVGFLYMAAQFKAERNVSALNQILAKDLAREMGWSGVRPQLSFIGKGGVKEIVSLIPPPIELTTRMPRFIVNTATGRFGPGPVERMAQARIDVLQAELDFDQDTLNALTDLILETFK